jgi:dTDP-4-dehydrorhamnose reductase
VRRILIIGASGQIGRRLRRRLADDEVAAPSHDELDLADADALHALVRGRRFDAILVPGGITSIEACQSDPQRALAVNAIGPGLLAEAAPTIYFSTDYVFDGRGGPYGTDAAPNPVSVYGSSKLEGERRVLAEGGTVIRTSHIFSADPGNNFFMHVARRLLAGQSVRGYTDQWSTPTDADALVEATIRLIGDRARGLVNLAGSEVCSRYEFACEVGRAFGREGVEAASMPVDLRPRRCGLVSDLISYRDGIARQRLLYT